jgi:Methyltransferase domain
LARDRPLRAQAPRTAARAVRPNRQTLRRLLAARASQALGAGAQRWADWTIGDRPVGAHITRYEMYRRLTDRARGLGFENNHSTRVLTISRSEPLCEILGLGEGTITSTVFPAFDLRSLPFDDDSFDVVVADQVLEHV